MPPKRKNTSNKNLFCMACGAQSSETQIFVLDEGFSLCEECIAANKDKLFQLFPEHESLIKGAVEHVNARYAAPHQNKKDPEVASFTVNVIVFMP